MGCLMGCLMLLAGCAAPPPPPPPPPPVLALGDVVGDLQAPRLPDLNATQPKGDKPPADLLPAIAGPETTVRGWQRHNIAILTFALPNGRVYAFSARRLDTGESQTWFDKDGDGVFEQTGPRGAVDERAYGY